MRKNILIPAAMVLVAAIIATVAIVVAGNDDEPTNAEAGAAAVVRDESHRLSDAPDGAPTFVEFLDFECEACGAAYPAIEEMRATYGDRIQFVARYFPLEGHFNAERAARAVEAAARQDQFEAMYSMMFETQASWGEQQVPLDDLFRTFAEEIGLDMAQFDADYDDPTTLERIRRDQADGRALGVESTPTFFLDGERFQPRSYDDLIAALDAAAA